MNKGYMNALLVVALICGWAYAEVIKIPHVGSPRATLHKNRLSSFPYISGDSFRAICKVVIDEERRPLDTNTLRDGDVIFVKTDLLDFFFNTVHPRLTTRYVLVTHNSDASAPDGYAAYLESPKLIAWFGHNCDIKVHPKFIPIPIGVANRYWSHGDIKILEEVGRQAGSMRRPWLLYLNQTDGNYRDERQAVRKLFSGYAWCVVSERKPYAQYLRDLTQAKFIVCPRGNGLDCHRPWEAMLMGAIPVLKRSTLDPVFDGLPVVLVDDWHEVTNDFLEKKYITMLAQKFELDRMLFPYWLKLIAVAAARL